MVVQEAETVNERRRAKSTEKRQLQKGMREVEQKMRGLKSTIAAQVREKRALEQKMEDMIKMCVQGGRWKREEEEREGGREEGREGGRKGEREEGREKREESSSKCVCWLLWQEPAGCGGGERGGRGRKRREREEEERDGGREGGRERGRKGERRGRRAVVTLCVGCCGRSQQNVAGERERRQREEEEFLSQLGTLQEELQEVGKKKREAEQALDLLIGHRQQHE